MTKSQARTTVSSLTANSPTIQVNPRRGRRMMKALKSSLCKEVHSNYKYMYMEWQLNKEL